MVGCVFAKDYKKLKKPSKKAGLRIRVVQKIGVPFFISRYRLRLGIVVGIVIFLSVLTILSNFVWSIEIVGLENLERQEVLEILDDLGLRVGSYIPSIDVRKMKQRFLLASDEVAWVGININSSVAEVQIHERVDAPDFTVDNDKACDVVASQAGVVKYMEVYDGQPQVKVGEVVLDGQLLVSGIVEDKKGNVTLKHARAKILALVWEDTEIVIDMERRYKIDTGEKKVLNSLVLFGAKIALYFSEKVDFEYYEESSSIPLSAFGFELPISIERRVLIGCEDAVERLSEASVKRLAFERLDEYIESEYSDAFIEKQDAVGRVEGGKYILSVSFTVKKDIALEKEILLAE